MLLSRRFIPLFACLATFIVYPGAAAASGPPLTARDAVTTVAFLESALAAAGLEVTELAPSAPGVAQHPLSVTAPAAPAFASGEPWGLRFTAPGGHFDDFAGGSLRHRGGFVLRWPGGEASFVGFELRPGREPRTLELLDAGGEVAFHGDHLHYELDAEGGRLQIFNVDLSFSDSLAERLERPGLAGRVAAVLTVTASAKGLEGQPRGGCPSNWEGTVDVALTGMSDVQEIGRAGGRVAIAPSARLKNVGTADVPWYSKFSGNFPPYDNDQHPFLVWSLFRIQDGVMRQLAVSDVKHAFLTVNTNCTGCGLDSHILGLGCEDVYGVFTNSNNNHLAPRHEIRPNAGIWAHCDEPEPNTPSHFDPDGDCEQDHSGGGEDAFSHGLVVDEVELMDAGARYYFHAWYAVRDDVDIFNTMGRRRIAPSFQGGSWSFDFLGNLLAGSPLDAWVDPDTPAPGELNASLAEPGGHLQLAVATRDLGGGLTRFDYALLNHDFDRRIQALRLPIAAGSSVSDLGFQDLDDDPANDWQATVAGGTITWQAPAGDDSLDWGVMFNFSFTSDGEVVESEATLVPSEAGTPAELRILTLSTAGDPTHVFSDGFESGDTSAW